MTKTVSVTNQQHATLLQNNIIPELQVQQALQTLTFKQDGAQPHIALPVQCLLSSTFGEDLIAVDTLITHGPQDLRI